MKSEHGPSVSQKNGAPELTLNRTDSLSDRLSMIALKGTSCKYMMPFFYECIMTAANPDFKCRVDFYKPFKLIECGRICVFCDDMSEAMNSYLATNLEKGLNAFIFILPGGHIQRSGFAARFQHKYQTATAPGIEVFEDWALTKIGEATGFDPNKSELLFYELVDMHNDMALRQGRPHSELIDY